MKTEMEQEQTERTVLPGRGNEMVQEIGIERVVPDPEQPRKVFDLAALQGLADSIKENGIVQPLIVAHPNGAKGDKFVLVAGERRLRAAKLAGLKSVPCIVRAVKNVFGAQMVENLQRENLSALEEAAALARRASEGRTAEQIAKELGISRATVFAKLRLNSLSGEVKGELLKGNITASVAGLIAVVPSEVQTKFLKEVLPGGNSWSDGPMSYRRAEELLERNFARQLGKASFDTKAEYEWVAGMVRAMTGGIAVAAGKAIKHCTTCEACPKRTGNMEGSGLKNGNVCTVPRCFELKTKADGALKAELARKQGRTVLEGKDAEKLFSQYGDEGVEHSSGFVELSGRADVFGWEWKRDWKETLGAHLLPKVPVVVAVDKAGRARELVKRAEVVAVLKEAGKIKPEKASASQAKWEKQRKAEEEKRQRVKAQAKVAHTELVLTASRPVKEMDAKFLQKLCLLAFDVANVDELEKRRGPKLREAKGATHREKFRDYVMNGLHAAEENLVGLLVDCLVTPEVRYDGNLGEGFQAALDLFGVKLEAGAPKAKGKVKQKATKGTKAGRGKKMGGKKMGKGKTKGAKKS